MNRINKKSSLKIAVNESELIERGYEMLRRENFETADECFDTILLNDQRNAKAYVGKLMVERKVNKPEKLAGEKLELERSVQYAGAVLFADDELKKELNEWNRQSIENRYDYLVDRLKMSRVNPGLIELAEIKEGFERLGSYKETGHMIQLCEEKQKEVFRRLLDAIDVRFGDLSSNDYFLNKKNYKHMILELTGIKKEKCADEYVTEIEEKLESLKTFRKKAIRREILILGRRVLPLAILVFLVAKTVWDPGFWPKMNRALYAKYEKGAYYGRGWLENRKEITIPEKYSRIGTHAFYDCDSIERICIPETVTGIEREAFARCDAVTEVFLPGTVVEIGDYAFAYCKNLSKVELGEGVETIGESIFQGCDSLKQVTIPSTLKQIDGMYIHDDEMIVYVTAGSYAEQWLREKGYEEHIRYK